MITRRYHLKVLSFIWKTQLDNLQKTVDSLWFHSQSATKKPYYNIIIRLTNIHIMYVSDTFSFIEAVGLHRIVCLFYLVYLGKAAVMLRISC